jgi:hypothetical protein
MPYSYLYQPEWVTIYLKSDGICEVRDRLKITIYNSRAALMPLRQQVKKDWFSNSKFFVPVSNSIKGKRIWGDWKQSISVSKF